MYVHAYWSYPHSAKRNMSQQRKCARKYPGVGIYPDRGGSETRACEWDHPPATHSWPRAWRGFWSCLPVASSTSQLESSFELYISSGVTVAHCSTLQHTAKHCDTLQYTHCNTLQHTVTHAVAVWLLQGCRVCVAVCAAVCDGVCVLQCVLQCVTVEGVPRPLWSYLCHRKVSSKRYLT